MFKIYFLAGFFVAAGVQVRWWVAFARMVVLFVFFVPPPFSPAQTLCEMAPDASWYNHSYFCSRYRFLNMSMGCNRLTMDACVLFCLFGILARTARWLPPLCDQNKGGAYLWY
jgi:hypothetical protein